MSGNKKSVETLKKKYGENYMAVIGSRGGKNGNNRPMKDPEYARKLANIRWAKHKKKVAK